MQILTKIHHRNEHMKSIFADLLSTNRRFDSMFGNLQRFSTSQINGCNKNDDKKVF